jgi:hypothetical protein
MCGQILVKIPNMKFHEKPAMGSALIHADRQTGMTRLLELAEEGKYWEGTE